jgi:hypothetical protein
MQKMQFGIWTERKFFKRGFQKKIVIIVEWLRIDRLELETGEVY